MLKATALVLSIAASAVAAPASACAWSSWKDVRHMFVFGDSYTQTGFDINGPQPNAANPFGNPTYPGPNWIDFLTTTHNASFIKTYNLASGGATIDASLVAPYAPTVLSLKDQFAAWHRTYAARPPTAPWTPKNTLFAFFIGINDVGNSWWLDTATLHAKIFAAWAALLDEAYADGARNFLLLGVPPLERAPLTLSKDDGGYAVETEGRVVREWNARVVSMADALRKKHGDVSVFVHDTWSVFDRVIRDPKAFEQTRGLKDVKSFCAKYASGTPQWDTKDPGCAFAVNEYLWLNDLHPTYPVHNATAADVAKFLGKQTCR